MNFHVSPAAAVAVRRPAAKKLTEAAVLARLGIGPEKPLRQWTIPELCALKKQEPSATAKAAERDRQTVRNVFGEIYEQIVRSKARTPAETAMQLEAIQTEAADNGIDGHCGPAELSRIIKQLAKISAAPTVSPAIAGLQSLIAKKTVEIASFVPELELLWAEFERLIEQNPNPDLSFQSRWDEAGKSEVSRRHSELSDQQTKIIREHDTLIEKLWALPIESIADARVKAGIFLKYVVLLKGLGDPEDEDADYDVMMAGKLLRQLAGK
jgi:hypothetical protein